MNDNVKKEFVPDFVENEQVRPAILNLAQLLTSRIPYKLKLKKLTKYDPEYWGLAMLLTDEMAEVALKMGMRIPRTMKEIVELTGKTESELEPLLKEMSFIGILEYNWENPQREKQWVLPMFVPGSAEFTNMNAEILEKHPEMGRFFEQMSRLPLEAVTPMVPPGGAGIGMHVIPVEKAIETENEAIGVEKISHWLNKYEGKYAASPCSCRRSRLTFDEGCADDPEGWCVAMGDMADYVVETGKGGRYITKNEALEIFKKAEENGFVHQITNIDGENKIFAICNCNVNVCYALRTSQLFNTPNLSRSAYVARVEKNDCVACGKCVESCPAGAVKLGQRLCTKDGKEVTYPKQPLPSEQKWGRHMWDENYRDNNTINCYKSGTAPCKTACPAHIAVQGYLKMASQGRYKEALELIKKDNPLPAICGRICNRRCEDACTRGRIDEAIAIDEIKKFIAEQDLHAETRFIPKKVIPSLDDKYFSQKIAIIGAGPAGLSCAFYLAEKGYSPTIFEKNEKPGGMLRYGVPSFKLEKDVIDAEIEVIKAMGVDIKCGVEVGKDVTLDDLRKEGYKAFYIAIGCQGARKLGIDGENADGVMSAVSFLHAVANDEAFKLSGKAVVIGGGNVAVDAARTAMRCGSEGVDIYCLESADNMTASQEEINEAVEDSVNINCGWGPKEILCEKGKVTGVIFKRCTSVFDENGSFSPAYDENDTITVPCDRVFISIGQSIIWGDLLKNSKVETDSSSRAIADKLTYQSAEADIFIGGDVYTGPKFAIDAIAAGREGAISIHRFVQPHSSLTIGRNRRDFIEFDKDNIKAEQYDSSARQLPETDESKKLTFRDTKKTFTKEQVKKETARCLGCGASIVDTNKCIGCGVCTTKCEFDAIKLYRENPECSTMIVSEKKIKYVLGNGFKQAMKIKFSKKKKD